MTTVRILSLLAILGFASPGAYGNFLSPEERQPERCGLRCFVTETCLAYASPCRPQPGYPGYKGFTHQLRRKVTCVTQEGSQTVVWEAEKPTLSLHEGSGECSAALTMVREDNRACAAN